MSSRVAQYKAAAATSATMRPAMAPFWSAAPSFLEAVSTGEVAEASLEPLRVGDVVELCEELWPPSVDVEFSWKTPPGKTSAVVELEGFATEDEVDDSEDVEVVEVVSSALLLDVLVRELDVVVSTSEGPSVPSILKTTMLACLPLGTVTTQKLASPTPLALTGLLTPPTPSVPGLIEQGKPLQPPPGHSILRPNVGLLLLSEHPMNMGFQAILTYVSPLATVFAPAT